LGHIGWLSAALGIELEPPGTVAILNVEERPFGTAAKQELLLRLAMSHKTGDNTRHAYHLV
jgi:hypothetical protein